MASWPTRADGFELLVGQVLAASHPGRSARCLERISNGLGRNGRHRGKGGACDRRYPWRISSSWTKMLPADQRDSRGGLLSQRRPGTESTATRGAVDGEGVVA